MKKLGFGCMRFPLLTSNEIDVDKKQTMEMIDLFIKNGYTYFDTAYMYHDHTSEQLLKELLVSRHSRESFLLADKLPLYVVNTLDDAKNIFKGQLEKCGVTYFDYYLLHNIWQGSYETVKNLDLFAFLRNLKQEGKVKHIGFSFHGTPELLDEVLTSHPEVEFVQLQLNYLDWDNPSVRSKECYEVCVKHNKKVIVMEPIRGGLLARLNENQAHRFIELDKSKSLASWALRFCYSLDNVMLILSGMSSLEQLQENTELFDNITPLNEIEQQTIKDVVNDLVKDVLIPCTSCSYCVAECPLKIAIPEYFAIYNISNSIYNPSRMRQIRIYNELKAKNENGTPDKCLKCGKCEKMCPQHISIREYLEKIKDFYEAEV